MAAMHLNLRCAARQTKGRALHLNTVYTAAWLLAWLAAASPAAADGPLTLRPVFLDSKKGQGATLGLEYMYERNWTAGGGDSSWDRLLEVRGQGTLAASSLRNPNKLLDLALNGRYQYQGNGWIGALGGALKAETDQSLDDRQWVYAAQLQGLLNNPLGRNGWAIAYLNLGRVLPGKDALRQQVLGDKGLNGYGRWDLELVWHLDLKGQIGGFPLQSLELQYRHHQEISPDAAIREAGIDRHRLGTVRLNIGGDKFVAFSRGSLPFDKQADRAVKLGWQYQF